MGERFEERGKGVKSLSRLENRSGIGRLGMFRAHLRIVAMNLK